MCEIDINTGKKLTESRILWQGTGGRFLEAPHIYHFGEYYYLLEAEGGTEYGHMVNYARSKSIWGPYESYPGNPVLTNRNLGGYPIQAAGHGDILEDINGNWWFAHLAFRQIDKWQTYHHLGREVCVVPMKWREDGWFELGIDGTTPTEIELPDSISFTPQDFTYHKTFENLTRENDWLFLRHPSMENYEFTQHSLKLKGTKTTLDEADSPTFAAVRQTEFMEDILCDITPGKQQAGIGFYMDELHHYEIVVDGIHNCAYLRQTIGVVQHCNDSVPLSGDSCRIHIVADNKQYHFYLADANGKETELGIAETRYLSSEVAGGFTGVVICLFAIDAKECGNWAEFTRLSISHK